MIGTGTLLNVGAIAVGSLIGVMIHSRLPKKMVDTLFQGIGLFTLCIGISMSLRSENMILIVVSIVVGSIIGQWIDIDRHLHRLTERLLSKGRKEDPSGRFTEGVITSSMLFCVGSMAILGAIEDGMGKSPDLLITKSIMDGISSIALATSFGIAILFSTIPVLIYQGGLTLFAAFIMRFMSEAMIADLTAVGGVLLVGLGINILKIKEINIINMLPALVVIVILSYFQ